MAEDLKSSPSGGSPRRKSSGLLGPALLSLALVSVLASAQDGVRVSMKIDVVAWGDDIGGLSFKTGKKEGEIIARSFTYSEPINYTGPRLLSIHQTGDGHVEKISIPGTPEDKEHESIPLPIEEIRNAEADAPIPPELAKRRQEDPTLVALVLLPPNCRRATVLLAPAAAGTYRGYAIDDDPGKLPLGKLRVHNLSPHTIAMQFDGGQAKQMKPREALLVNPVEGHTIYQLAYLIGEEWTMQENNIIPVQPDEQTQLLVLKSNNPFFLSADGASGGYLQLVALRRSRTPPPAGS